MLLTFRGWGPSARPLRVQSQNGTDPTPCPGPRGAGRLSRIIYAQICIYIYICV